MTSITTPADAVARPVQPRLEWGKALRALRRLLRDNEDTVQVFEIMRALNGRSTARGYRRLLLTREGGRQAYERAEMAGLLMDSAWLNALPAGSVGAAYRGFMQAEQLSAAGLVDVSRQGLSQIEDPHPYAWFGRRTRDIHDVWHVLTGYGRDSLGEASLVAFSYAQTQGLGWGLIAVAAAIRARGGRQPVARAILEGYRRGRKAAWLQAEDYEQLLREPLELARRRLRIGPAPVYDSIPQAGRDRPLG
jgi:ubiquinone biosynthesis protein COQ4